MSQDSSRDVLFCAPSSWVHLRMGKELPTHWVFWRGSCQRLSVLTPFLVLSPNEARIVLFPVNKVTFRCYWTIFIPGWHLSPSDLYVLENKVLIISLSETITEFVRGHTLRSTSYWLIGIVHFEFLEFNFGTQFKNILVLQKLCVVLFLQSPSLLRNWEYLTCFKCKHRLRAFKK